MNFIQSWWWQYFSQRWCFFVVINDFMLFFRWFLRCFMLFFFIRILLVCWNSIFLLIFLLLLWFLVGLLCFIWIFITVIGLLRCFFMIILTLLVFRVPLVLAGIKVIENQLILHLSGGWGLLLYPCWDRHLLFSLITHHLRSSLLLPWRIILSFHRSFK